MKPFNKILYLGTQPEYKNNTPDFPAKVFCKVKVEDKLGKGLMLSISGVVHPYSNGDCLGSCGQIYDSLNINQFATGWDQETLNKFVDIWRKYHLNDMKAYTPDMLAQGWDKLASKPINKYSFGVTDENRTKKDKLKEAIVQHAIEDKQLSLSSSDKRLLTSNNYLDVYAYELPNAPEFMELQLDYRTKQPKIEAKTLGWVNVEEHPDGLLGKELNGLKYGHAWYFHEIPDEVLQWLYKLPDSELKPAWI